MSHVVSPIREKLVTGGKSYHDVTHDICKQVEGEPTKEWKWAFGISCIIFAYGAYCLFYTWWQGIGVWGLGNLSECPRQVPRGRFRLESQGSAASVSGRERDESRADLP